jgi:hypothetical protein
MHVEGQPGPLDAALAGLPDVTSVASDARQVVLRTSAGVDVVVLANSGGVDLAATRPCD